MLGARDVLGRTDVVQIEMLIVEIGVKGIRMVVKHLEDAGWDPLPLLLHITPLSSEYTSD